MSDNDFLELGRTKRQPIAEEQRLRMLILQQLVREGDLVGPITDDLLRTRTAGVGEAAYNNNLKLQELRERLQAIVRDK
jgi:hypothetical protein